MSRFCLLIFAVSVSLPVSGLGQWSPAETEVLVLGSPHLWQQDKINASHLESIQKKLVKFAPQLVAVEWLHPSIDPETTDNYAKLGDARTLAKLWGFKRKGLANQIEEIEKKVSAEPAQAAQLRVKLGKLHYLADDSLNAGYQWWLASKLGVDTSELARLTDQNFEGHELQVFGFHAARENGLQRVTPFDYQGRDADWNNVYGELIEAVAATAVPGSAADTTIADKRKAFLSEMESNPAAWAEKQMEIPSLREFARTIRSTLALQKAADEGGTNHPLGTIGYLQSAESIRLQHQMYYEGLWKVPYSGLGRQLVVNYERRNEKMASFVQQDARVAKASRVLVIVGAGHKLFLDRIFKARGYQVRDSAAFLDE